MRRVALLVLLAACGPKVSVQTSPFDVDDPRAGTPVQHSQFRGWEERAEAPKGEGLRTGTIDRTILLGVLDAGPGAFLHENFEVTAAKDGDTFVGWQLVQILDKQSVLHRLDVTGGDILISINGFPLSRPDQLMAAWDALRTADQLDCAILRGDARFELVFAITPPAGRVPPDLAPKPAPATPVAPPASPAPAAPAVPVKLKP